MKRKCYKVKQVCKTYTSAMSKTDARKQAEEGFGPWPTKGSCEIVSVKKTDTKYCVGPGLELGKKEKRGMKALRFFDRRW